MNFKNIAIQNKELPVLSSTIIQRLLIALASGQRAIHDNVEYSAAEVNQMLRNQSSGLKPTRVSIYSGDYCMTQGVAIEPQITIEETPVFKVTSTSNNIELPFTELPSQAGVVDLEKVVVSGKRYYLPLGLKEDIKIFASLFKYSESSALQKKTWSYMIVPTSVWAQHGFYSKQIPFNILDHIRPDRVMSGQDLIEYLYNNKSTWPLVRTAVWAMLKDVTVPAYDDNGDEIYNENGDLLVDYANDTIDFSCDGNQYSAIDRVHRPAMLMFKCSTDKYQAKMQLDKLREQVNLSTVLETHNDYYDGIDYSINCDNIRAKMTIIHNLDLSNLPKDIGVVTNQTEEYEVLLKYFAKRYPDKKLVRLTEKSAHNYYGFKFFMRPISSLIPVEIHDKATVSRSMQENSSIIESIRANEYPDGFGFMTHPLIAHYLRGQEPREKRGPGNESTYLDLEDGRIFKQLQSAMPLHFFPYISGKQGLVDLVADRTYDIIDTIRKHAWTLINYPITKATYCEAFGGKPVTIKWTPGKTAVSIAFELDSSFTGYVKSAKSGEVRSVVRPRNQGMPFLHVEAAVPQPSAPSLSPRKEVPKIPLDVRVPQVGLGGNLAPKVPPSVVAPVYMPPPLPEKPHQDDRGPKMRTNKRIRTMEMDIDTTSDVDE